MKIELDAEGALELQYVVHQLALASRAYGEARVKEGLLSQTALIQEERVARWSDHFWELTGHGDGWTIV